MSTNPQQTIETCPDDHHCLHSSKCVENPYAEGSYYCDCRESDFEAAYEGLRCEHRADVYCVSEGISKHSFCTNGGICLEYVGPDEAHMGCDCPKGYEGSYCQFVEGSRPRGYPFLEEEVIGVASLRVEKRTDGGAVFGGVVAGICVGVLAAVSVVYYLKRRSGMIGHESVPTRDLLGSPCNNNNSDGRDLCMEADGGVMTRSVERSMDKSNGALKVDAASLT